MHLCANNGSSRTLLLAVADLEIQNGGFSHWRAKAARKFFGSHTHFQSRWKSELNISKQLVKCLEISKELIRECVSMPGCCCCMPLLHNHLMDLCIYVRKNTLLAARGGSICTPLTPPESATDSSCMQFGSRVAHRSPDTT